MKTTLFTLAFTDVFGVNHPAAQCYIANVSHNASVNFNEAGDAANQSSQVSYQVRFWHDETTKADGAKTQEIVSKVGQSTFYITDISSDASITDLPAVCAEHFEQKVLPNLHQTPTL
jgi:hypothetical protein